MPWNRAHRALRLRAILSAATLSAVALTSACSRSMPESGSPPSMESSPAPAAVATAALGLQAPIPSPGTPALAQRAMRITVETTILVDAFEPAMQRLRAAVEEHGGYVSDARVRFGQHHGASLEARVPAARVGTFRAAVASIGEVVADAEKAEDVTEQRADIGARLRNARAQEKRLLDLLSDRTGSLADVVAVEGQLGSVRERIEQIEAQERLLEGQIAYATVKISVTARRDEAPVGAGGRIARAAEEGIENAGAFVVNSVIFLATAGPTLLLLAAIAAVLYYALYRVLRRRSAASRVPPFQAGPAQPYPGAPPPVHGPYGAYGPSPAHGAPPAQAPHGAPPFQVPHSAPPAQAPHDAPPAEAPHSAPPAQAPHDTPPPRQGAPGGGEAGPG